MIQIKIVGRNSDGFLTDTFDIEKPLNQALKAIQNNGGKILNIKYITNNKIGTIEYAVIEYEIISEVLVG